jgi:hypothetical protein
MSGLAASMAGANITASAAGNGILVLIALILFAVAAVVAWVVTPRAIWASCVALGLALYMAALLIGG